MIGIGLEKAEKSRLSSLLKMIFMKKSYWTSLRMWMKFSFIMEVGLWWDYVNNNNQESLKTLLDYNREDVVNVRVLRRKLGIR